MSEDLSFVVRCHDCEMGCETNDLDEALTFAVKHQQHTGHSVMWEKSTLIDDIISIPQRTRWKVKCDTCGTERLFHEKDQAQQFYHDHETYAGHFPQEPEQIELPKISEISVSDLEAILDYCFENAETVDTVPTEVILKAFEEEGIGREWTSEKLEQTAARDDIYHLGNGLLAR